MDLREKFSLSGSHMLTLAADAGERLTSVLLRRLSLLLCAAAESPSLCGHSFAESQRDDM